MRYNSYIMNKKIVTKNPRNYNSGIGVLDKIIFILESIAINKKLNLNEIVEITGITRSTAHRLLHALEAHHILVKEREEYLFGSRIKAWGEMSSHKTLIEIAEPILSNLTNETGESSQLYIREGSERICIAASEPSIGLKNTVPIGSVLPLDLGSAGKLFKAWEENFVSNSTNSDQKEFTGWTESVEEREEGVASVSAPVLLGDQLIAAISVSGPLTRMGDKPGNKFSSYVVKSAKEISNTLKNANYI